MAANQDVIFSPNKSKIFTCDKHVNISNKIKTFHEGDEPFDITLIAGPDDYRVQAHRSILSASSKYFLAMFRSGLQDGTATEIKLQDIGGDILKLIVGFMHTGSIELHTDTAEEILKAAHYLGFPTLLVACCEFIGQQLDVSNCIGYVLLAKLYSLTELHKESSYFACKNLEEVCQEEEFLAMNSTHLSELLGSDDASVASEEVVFRSVMAWVNHNKVNREDLMPSLLSVVRFSLLTPQFIFEHVVPVFETDRCPKVILTWLQWHFWPSCRTNLSNSFNTKPRRSNKKTFVLSVNKATDAWCMQAFDSELNVWSSQDLPLSREKRTNFGAILKNGKLIITEGRSRGETLNTVDCLDLVTLEWTTLPKMREARFDHAMAELGGNLYVIGGLTQRLFINNVMEMFDFTTREWTDLAPIPLKIAANLQSAVSNGKLYICSDENLLCYDPAKNDWTNHPITKFVNFGLRVVRPHPIRVVFPRQIGFVAVGDHLYLAYEEKSKIWFELKIIRFNTLTGELQTDKFPRSKISYSASSFALNYCGRVLFWGTARDGGRILEEYDPHTNKLTNMAPMLHGDNLYVRNSL